MAFRRLHDSVRLCLKAVASASSAVLNPLQHDSTTHVTLDSLPIEILLCIAEGLGAADVASVSLCNRRLQHKLSSSYHAVSTRQCKTVTEGSACDLDSRRDLLHRFVRDDSRYYLCTVCDRLHPVKAVGPPIWSWKCVPHACERIGIDHPFHVFSTHRWPTAYHLTFDHVQCIMARHRSGCGSGHALEILQACEIADPRGFDDPITLLSVEPAIVNDELNLRIQQWIVFASRHLEKSVELQQLSICNHFNNDDDTLGPILECKLRHRETRQGCATCHPYLRCPRCHIEFNIRTRDLGVDGSAVIITKWVRLGRGLSPTDPHWHLNAWESAFMQRNVPEQATDDGSLHARFERQATMGIDALFIEYMSLLRGKSYRRALLHSYKSSDPDLGDVWIRSPRVERNAHYYNNYPYAIY